MTARADGAAVAQTCWCSKRPLMRLFGGKEPWSISRPFSAPSSPVDTDSVDTNGKAVGLSPPGLGGAGAPPPPPPPGGRAAPPQSPSALFCDGGFTPPLVAVAEQPLVGGQRLPEVDRDLQAAGAGDDLEQVGPRPAAPGHEVLLGDTPPTPRSGSAPVPVPSGTTANIVTASAAGARRRQLPLV